MDAIERYLSTVLTPQLLALGVQTFPGVMEQVIADIRRRLHSALSHWNEALMRKTILLPGWEEGWFYAPDTAPPAIRALVVIAIRNSLLEDLGATSSSLFPVGGAAGPMRDRDVRPITEAAIKYFQTLPLPELRVAPLAKDEDIFGNLAAAYPHAWHVLLSLAGARQHRVQIPPCKAARPSLPKVTGTAHGTASALVASGIDPRFDAVLVEQLRLIQSGKMKILFSDSWRGFTRRPEKLYRILDFVLAYQGTVVTFNYLLTPRLACVRKQLVRISHTAQDAQWRLAHLEMRGLEREHWRALSEMGRALKEDA